MARLPADCLSEGTLNGRPERMAQRPAFSEDCLHQAILFAILSDCEGCIQQHRRAMWSLAEASEPVRVGQQCHTVAM